jgi:hypothetical protein
MVAADNWLLLLSPAARVARALRSPVLVVGFFLTPLSAVCLLSTLPAAERDTSPSQATDSPSSLHELEGTIRARAALSSDPELASLNLGVKVRKGVATLWGPIPSEELIRRAIRTLEKVRGIYEVRSELFVVAPQPGLVVLPMPDPPARSESASPDRRAGRLDELTGRTAKPARTPVTLLAPIAADEPVAARGAPPGQIPGSPSVESVRQAVQRLQQSDLRFQAIQADVRNGRVLVRGGTVRGEYVTAFALAVSKVPGVGQVIVEPKD